MTGNLASGIYHLFGNVKLMEIVTHFKKKYFSDPQTDVKLTEITWLTGGLEVANLICSSTLKNQKFYRL